MKKEEEYKDLYGRVITRDQYVCSRVCTPPDHNICCPFNKNNKARTEARSEADFEAGFRAQFGRMLRLDSELRSEALSGRTSRAEIGRESE